MENRYKNLDFGDLFVTAFKAIFDNFTGYLSVLVLNIVPLLVFGISVVSLVGVEAMASLGDWAKNPQDFMTQMNIWEESTTLLYGLGISGLLTAVATLITAPAAYAANYLLFNAYYKNETMTFTEAMNAGYQNWTKVLLAALLVFLISIGVGIGGLVAVFVVGAIGGMAGVGVAIGLGVLGGLAYIAFVVFMTVKLNFVVQSAVLGDYTTGEALSRSMKLSKGRFWMTFGYIIGGSIILGIIFGVPSMIFMNNFILSNSIGSLFSLFSSVVAVNFMTGLYLRLVEETDGPFETPESEHSSEVDQIQL